MFISKFMTKDVVSLSRETDIAEARKLMIRCRIRHIPVTRSDNTLIGIVSDRDIRSAMPSKYFHDHGIKEMESARATGVSVQDIGIHQSAGSFQGFEFHRPSISTSSMPHQRGVHLRGKVDLPCSFGY